MFKKILLPFALVAGLIMPAAASADTALQIMYNRMAPLSVQLHAFSFTGDQRNTAVEVDWTPDTASYPYLGKCTSSSSYYYICAVALDTYSSSAPATRANLTPYGGYYDWHCATKPTTQYTNSTDPFLWVSGVINLRIDSDSDGNDLLCTYQSFNSYSVTPF